MKKVLAALVLSLVFAGSAFAAVTLTYAEVNPLDSIVGQTATAFKQKVEELSNGEVIIDIQA
ncbi:MAG: hypothetical protein IJU15_05735, partial [Synergistaceae bacterium]|nr:hypothetical protein [Synergistaceae bacterium]